MLSHEGMSTQDNSTETSDCLLSFGASHQLEPVCSAMQSDVPQSHTQNSFGNSNSPGKSRHRYNKRRITVFCSLEMSSTIRRLLLSNLFFILLLISSVFGLDVEKLPLCTPFQACAAEVGQYPLLSETIGNMVDLPSVAVDGSGQEGSGEAGINHLEESFPFYDEFVTRETLFDYNADPDLTHAQFCRCPLEDDESSGQCNFLTAGEDLDNVMKIDASLKLAFCRQVDAKTGDAITAVNDTAVFCRCDSGHFQRMSIEPWMDKYAFTYRCTWSPTGKI